ncbi:MAG: hypothetical protein AB7T27_06985 [Kiritimatiellia bacterium]
MYRSADFERPADRADKYLAAARRLVPADLISDEGYKRIIQSAAGLPSRTALFYGLLEFPLDDSSALGDLSFALHHDSGCCDLLLSEWAQRGDRHSAWEHAVKLISGMRSPGGVLLRYLRSSGIEFDCSRDPDVCPSVFLTPAIQRSSKDVRANEIGMAETTARMLGEKAYPRSLLNKTLNAITALPEGCRIAQFGIMLSRDPAAIRLCCEGLDRITADQLSGFLQKTGYGGISDTAIAYRDKLSALGGAMDLAIDADTSSGERLGWELSFKNHAPSEEPGWRRALEIISSCAGCSTTKMDAFLNASGYLAISDHLEVWPGDVRRCWEKHALECFSYLVVNPNHIKLVIGPGGLVKAKGYLRISHYWKDLL